MVADLVGDDIGLGKIAGRAELVAQIVVKGQVDINLVVARTVKRPHGRLRHAAG